MLLLSFPAPLYVQGQAVCPDYSMYGICKFGPTCRYDHPLPAYPYNYSLSLPSLSIMDSALITYPRMVQAAPVSLSKLPDLIHNPAGVNYNRHQNPDTSTKISDDPTEQAGSPPPHSSQASSEPSHD